MNIGWLVLSSSRTAVRRLCGQFWAAQRICRPLIGPHQRAHLAAADEEIRDIRRGYAGLQHKDRSEAKFWKFCPLSSGLQGSATCNSAGT